MGHLAELASIALAQWRIEASIALARLAHSKSSYRTGPSSYPFSLRLQAAPPRMRGARSGPVCGALAQLGERLNRIQ